MSDNVIKLKVKRSKCAYRHSVNPNVLAGLVAFMIRSRAVQNVVHEMFWDEIELELNEDYSGGYFLRNHAQVDYPDGVVHVVSCRSAAMKFVPEVYGDSGEAAARIGELRRECDLPEKDWIVTACRFFGTFRGNDLAG